MKGAVRSYIANFTTAFPIFATWGFRTQASFFDYRAGNCEPNKEGREEDRDFHASVGGYAGLGRLFVTDVCRILVHTEVGRGGNLYMLVVGKGGYSITVSLQLTQKITLKLLTPLRVSYFSLNIRAKHS
jgi:hypothetical protein